MVKMRGSKRRAQKSHEKVASDSPAEEKQPPLTDHAIFDEDEVLDPDPIRWALPADGKPVHKGKSKTFTEVQLVHMYHLGHMVGWSLEKYHGDRIILTQICEKIGISRDQFRGWIYSKKFKLDKAGSSGSGSGRSGGNFNDEGDSSATD